MAKASRSLWQRKGFWGIVLVLFALLSAAWFGIRHLLMARVQEVETFLGDNYSREGREVNGYPLMVRLTENKVSIKLDQVMEKWAEGDFRALAKVMPKGTVLTIEKNTTEVPLWSPFTLVQTATDLAIATPEGSKPDVKLTIGKMVVKGKLSSHSSFLDPQRSPLSVVIKDLKVAAGKEEFVLPDIQFSSDGKGHHVVEAVGLVKALFQMAHHELKLDDKVWGDTLLKDESETVRSLEGEVGMDIGSSSTEVSFFMKGTPTKEAYFFAPQSGHGVLKITGLDKLLKEVDPSLAALLQGMNLLNELAPYQSGEDHYTLYWRFDSTKVPSLEWSAKPFEATP